MSDLLLDLDELNVRHEKSKSNKMQLYDEILKSCHNKIRKYNKEFAKRECLFKPPPFVIGKPPYQYGELLTYLIDSLRKNGLRAEWMSTKESLYISWRKEDINQDQYQQHFSKTVYQSDYDDQLKIMAIKPAEASSSSSGIPQQNKRKDVTIVGNKAKPLMQHVAMIEYGHNVKDMIPVNSKITKSS